jgi:hypothetical protein
VSSTGARLRALLDAWFSVDVRALAAWRVALGLVVIVDAIDRARTPALWSLDGWMPLAMSKIGPWRPSLPFDVVGHDLWALWVGLLGLAGLALVVGWWSRTAAAVAWVVGVSLQARNPITVYGSDLVLNAMLMWATLLPIGAFAAVDARGRPQPSRTVLSVASAGVTLQLLAIYLVSWFEKRGEAWVDGTAGWYALNYDTFVDRAGVALRAWPGLLRVGTYATLWLELLGPLLLFVPWRRDAFRAGLVLAFWMFHLALELTLEIGWFPWVCIASWVVLVPGRVWDALGIAAPHGEPIAVQRSLHGVAGALIGVLAWWNVAHVTPSTEDAPTGTLRLWVYKLRLDQDWSMYAPEPSRWDGWWRIEGYRGATPAVDLLTGAPPTDARPDDLPARYGSIRANKHMNGLWAKVWEPARTPLLAWWCRNAPEPERLTALDLVLVKERSPAPGTDQPPPRAHRQMQVRCEDVALRPRPQQR